MSMGQWWRLKRKKLHALPGHICGRLGLNCLTLVMMATYAERKSITGSKRQSKMNGTPSLRVYACKLRLPPTRLKLSLRRVGTSLFNAKSISHAAPTVKSYNPTLSCKLEPPAMFTILSTSHGKSLRIAVLVWSQSVLIGYSTTLVLSLAHAGTVVNAMKMMFAHAPAMRHLSAMLWIVEKEVLWTMIPVLATL